MEGTMSRTASIVLLLVVASAASADTRRKEVWEWTVEERLAARFDLGSRQARVDEHARSVREKRPTRPGGNSVESLPLPFDSLRGNATPELLLASEIFGEFVRVAYAFDDDVASQIRLDAERRAALAGLPPTFMVALGDAVRDYAETERGVRELRERLNRGAGAETEQLLTDLRRMEAEACRRRVSAMNALRAEYAGFDRFLYQGLAANLSFAIFEVQEPETLRRNERGCR
jgi:hypothetical protein